MTNPSTMGSEEFNRRFGVDLPAPESDIMETIRKNYNEDQIELGWWGRLMLRKFEHIEKPPFLPWIPSCYANLIEGTIVLSVVLILLYLVLRGATSCS